MLSVEQLPSKYFVTASNFISKGGTVFPENGEQL
jgi:hypothetical protein